MTGPIVVTMASGVPNQMANLADMLTEITHLNRYLANATRDRVTKISPMEISDEERQKSQILTKLLNRFFGQAHKAGVSYEDVDEFLQERTRAAEAAKVQMLNPVDNFHYDANASTFGDEDDEDFDFSADPWKALTPPPVDTAPVTPGVFLPQERILSPEGWERLIMGGYVAPVFGDQPDRADLGSPEQRRNLGIALYTMYSNGAEMDMISSFLTNVRVRSCTRGDQCRHHANGRCTFFLGHFRDGQEPIRLRR